MCDYEPTRCSKPPSPSRREAYDDDVSEDDHSWVCIGKRA